MSIVSHNALLNQYVPTFYLKDLRDGQTLVFDARRKAFVNATGSAAGDYLRLSDLLDVDDSVGNPLVLQPGQSLQYNAATGLWQAGYVDFETIRNKPTSGDYSFAGLSDVAKPSVPGAFVRWDALGSELVYTLTIAADEVVGLSSVAYTGDYLDLSNLPVLTDGTVTQVTFNDANGVYGVVTNNTTTPEITLALGDITPISVTAQGEVTASNISGVNTGDQTIILQGDATGTGTGDIMVTLADTGVAPGTYGDTRNIPVITVDSKGRLTHVSVVPLDAQSSGGTVTSVIIEGTTGITVSGNEITTSGTYTIGLADTGIVPGAYGDATQIPSVELNAAGQVTQVTMHTVDTTVRDYIAVDETVYIRPRHQYIVTGTLEVDGRIENNGRIAIL